MPPTISVKEPFPYSAISEMQPTPPQEFFDAQERIASKRVQAVREACEAAGMPWAFWNFFDGMGLTTDDTSRAFDPAITAALGLRDPGARVSGSKR